MIPIYNRVTWLEEALRSVTSQFPPDGEAVQIEVVDDCSPDQPDLDAIVARVGDARVKVVRNETRRGMVGNWNACIERARGRWVHLLHDDDYVLPGFYAAHRSAIESNPSIGWSACGGQLLEGEKATPWKPLLDEAGVAPDWLRWLIYSNWLLMPTVVVKRDAYEAVGGFHPSIEHCVDWEMWMRLASRYPIWIDPVVRAVYRKHAASETSRQVRSGANVADIGRALDVAREYLPADRADALVRLSRDAWARGVMNGIRDFLRRGDVVAAMAQFREAMKLSVSPTVLREIETGVMKYFDSYYAAVEAVIAKLRDGQADATALWQLRDVRRRLCNQWLELPADQLQIYFDGDLGRLHKLLETSGLANTPIDELDQQLIESLPALGVTNDHAGLVRSLYVRRPTG